MVKILHSGIDWWGKTIEKEDLFDCMCLAMIWNLLKPIDIKLEL